MTTINQKVCLMGDFAVGKKSLMRRFVHKRFEEHYLSKIGVKVSRKTVIILRRLNAPYYLTSAKQGDGGEILFRQLGTLLVG